MGVYHGVILEDWTSACEVVMINIDELMKERRNPIANALGLRLSCTDQMIYELWPVIK